MDFEAAVKSAKRTKKPSSVIERSSAKKLTQDKRNPNKSNERGAEMIAESLTRLKTGRSIVVDRHGVVIGGNQTLKAYQALGKDDVDIIESDGSRLIVVKRTDLDLAEGGIARELSLADNRTSEISYEVDPTILEELTKAGDLDLSWMYSDDELATILAANAPAQLLTDEDEVPEPPAKPVSKRGDIWLCGKHRVMCGDSTNAEDVAKLMDGAKADMVFTDPPYGVSIVSTNIQVGKRIPSGLQANRGTDGASKAFGSVGSIHRGMKAKPIIAAGVYADIIGDDTTETAVKEYKLCAALKIKVLIFWGGNYYAEALPPSSCWIVWDKDNGESFFADAELAWTNQKTAVRIFKHQWNGLMKGSERGQKRVHPTQKPIALAEWCFEKYGKVEDRVLDLFGGSGSTLIACEKANRSCYMMEMSESYVDVIITRWEQATGQKAVLYGSKEGKPGNRNTAGKEET